VLYESTVRLNLKPALGITRLNQLSVPLTQAFLNEMIASGHSVRKVDSVREILSSALGSACREELIARNVASLVRLPKHQKSDIIPWTTAEARGFLECTRSNPQYAALVLSTLYGMRRGEVLGLRWEDVDFERGVLRVRQQLQRSFGELQLSPLKTDAGRRDIPLVSFARDVLRTHQGQGSLTAGLVFTTENDTPIDPRNYSRLFKLLCKRHKVRRIKLHHVRHTTATLLKDLGVPDRDIQIILGHAHVSTTQQIYQHASMETRTAALEKLERLFMRAAGSVRSRQMLPSGSNIIAELTSSIFGAPGKIRTCDPLVRSHPKDQIEDRFTKVKIALDGSRCVWLLGAVAVNVAVNLSCADAIRSFLDFPMSQRYP
jgi:integrase